MKSFLTPTKLGNFLEGLKYQGQGCGQEWRERNCLNEQLEPKRIHFLGSTMEGGFAGRKINFKIKHSTFSDETDGNVVMWPVFR